MEYVAGETLGQLVARRAVRGLWEKLEILEELCAGLHYAHTAAIVHRDIKPSNVMRDQTGVVKILDFGIARGAGGVITQAGEVVGTPTTCRRNSSPAKRWITGPISTPLACSPMS